MGKRFKSRWMLAGLALAFGALVFSALVLLGNTAEQKRTTAWVSHTREVMVKLNQVVTYLSEAETGRRGFVLSGQDRYLGHHTGRVSNAQQALSELRELTRDNPRQAAAAERLAVLMQERLAISTNSIQARRLRGLDLPEQIRFIEQGQQAMEPIRLLVNTMLEEEHTLLQTRQAERDKSIDGAAGFAVLVSLLGLLLFAVQLVMFIRADRARRRAEVELKQANAELELRVEDRTRELTKSLERSAWLASFPENNPNPVLEIDLAANALNYINPTARGVFPDLKERGLEHPFLVDLHSATKPLLEGGSGPVRREVECGGSCFAQTISYVPETRRVRVYAADITARTEAEAALRESEAKFRVLAESLPQLVWTSGPDGAFDYVSESWVAFTGRLSREFLGQGWADFLDPADRDPVIGEWEKAVQSGQAFDHEFRLRRADGELRWFKSRALPLRDEDGAIVKWFGTNTDFDDQKKIETRLQTQLERLNLLDRTTQAIGERQDLKSILQVVIRSLEDHLPVDFACMCTYDASQPALTVNHVGAKSQALALELALAAPARIELDENGLSRCVKGELVYEPDVAEVAFPFPQRLARGGLRSLVVAPLPVDGRVFGLLLVARREANSFSSPDCEFIRQLSEHLALAVRQSQLHGALLQAYEELRHTQQAVMQQERLRALGQMASGIAHDINNAISPVALYTEALLEKEPNLSDKARDYLATIARAIDDVAQTVGRMREFYRQRVPQLTLAPVDLNTLAQQVADLTRARWSDIPQQRGIVIELRMDLEPNLPSVMAVESEIREALTNLIFNAVDAMPAGGTITVRTRSAVEQAATATEPEQRFAWIEVGDTGVGMDEETRRRCFEPFFTTKGERGTGLGLAMVYGVVQRHSADISIDSTIGRGTTLKLKFLVPSAPVSMPPRPAQMLGRGAQLRILVVDDDPLLLKSLRDTLESEGHTIVTAHGGQEGIENFHAAHDAGEPFDIVITDLGMPYVDGRKVASTVKEISQATPVILLTGWGQRLVAEGEVPPHVDRVMNKPPKPQQLRDELARWSPAAARSS